MIEKDFVKDVAASMYGSYELQPYTFMLGSPLGGIGLDETAEHFYIGRIVGVADVPLGANAALDVTVPHHMTISAAGYPSTNQQHVHQQLLFTNNSVDNTLVPIDVPLIFCSLGTGGIFGVFMGYKVRRAAFTVPRGTPPKL